MCFRPAKPALRCSKCHETIFCSQTCFGKAWSKWHKALCGIKWSEQGLSQQDLTDAIMLIRVLMAIRDISNDKSSDQVRSSKGVAVKESLNETSSIYSTLMTHYDSITPTKKHRWREIARVLLTIPALSIWTVCKDPDEDAYDHLARHISLFHCNSFTVHDQHYDSIADGTFPFGSQFNHSCYPNCSLGFDFLQGREPLMLIKAIEDISTGQELVISYIDGINGVAERQRHLKEHYYFTCQCKRCSTQDFAWSRILGEMSLTDPTCDVVEQIHDWHLQTALVHILGNDIYQPLQPMSSPLVTFATTVLQWLIPQVYSTANVDDLQSRAARSITPKEALLPWLIPLNRYYDNLITDDTELDRHVNLLKTSLIVLAFYLVSYPRYHPMVGYQLVRVCSHMWNALLAMEMNGEKPIWSEDVVKAWVEHSERVVRVAYEPDSESSQQLIMLKQVIDTDN
ncbi:hypothetical protein BZG36_02911 [Bifiguratus adelaidae]|uniref:MYND-type domain-containing protein n=1 Tax=Bifiguratus adelaidae TaxID=1938954 RepID=A0A261Y1F2_9FUNG|nr:hypothetical protein BZG36_02911 [Bifiguratus adelaidae]